MGKLLSVTDREVIELLEESRPYSAISEDSFKNLGKKLVLPDGGKIVRNLAHAAQGAFNPKDLEKMPVKSLGYNPKWVVIRYTYYELEWDITGLRLESLNPDADKLPWMIIINGGSANFYEFFVTPTNEAGLGQYLAQKMNVLLVTIPGNFKYGGWKAPLSERNPQYIMDYDLPIDEVKLRNAIYTNKVVFEGLKRLITQQTIGDILIVGHSTSGQLPFLAMSEKELSERLKGRFLGWGSAGPPNFKKEWEEKFGKRKILIDNYSKRPPLQNLRTRNTREFIEDFGYIGPLNPCGAPGMKEIEVAERWFELEHQRRPNFKQTMQDMENRAAIELKSNIASQLNDILSKTKFPVKVENVLKDLFVTTHVQLTGYKKMIWMLGKWDKLHCDKDDPANGLDFYIAEQFRKRNPEAMIRVLLFDLPMTHYGHIEMPQQVAGAFMASAHWLIK